MRSLPNTQQRLIVLLFSGVFFIVFSFSVKPAWANTSQQQIFKIDLEQAISLAFSSSYQLKLAEFNPEYAQQDLELAKARHDAEFFSSYNEGDGKTSSELFSAPSASAQKSAASGLRGLLPTGTKWRLGVDARSYESGEILLPDASGYYSSLEIIQPLLKGAWLASAYSDVRLQQNNQKLAQLQFKDDMMSLVKDVVAAYVDMYAAQQGLNIAIENRDLAKQTLEQEQERHRLGKVAQSDLYRPDATYALREDAVIRAEQLLRLQENSLKALLFSDLDAVMGRVQVATLPAIIEVDVDTKADFDQALALRPDFNIAQLQQQNRQTELKRDQRNRLPQLDLVMRYQQSSETAERGLDQAYEAYRGEHEAGHYVGLNFSVPLTNKQGRAQARRSQLALRQAQLQIKQLEQRILLTLDTAAYRLRQDWKRVEAAKRSVQLAQLTLNAEEEKMAVGRSNNFFVLDLQSRLAAARSQQVSADASYIKSYVEYLRQNGRILEYLENEPRSSGAGV
ncbi:TolC family protein [Agaribacterium haliotis]|uniref:TolC family protein n=1 Tax=Agaribacterium haliotis TaxID=2013869 RepID=UPI000BB543ED|nr:TolC family protein [Agaribacterium haliotis]